VPGERRGVRWPHVCGEVDGGSRGADGFCALAHPVGLEGLKEADDVPLDAGRDINGGDKLREILDRTGYGYGKGEWRCC
jgi:hypothetical protein